MDTIEQRHRGTKMTYQTTSEYEALCEAERLEKQDGKKRYVVTVSIENRVSTYEVWVTQPTWETAPLGWAE